MTAGAFDVVPMVASQYVDPAWDDLDGAEAEAQAIGELFARFGGVVVAWDAKAPERDLGAVDARLRRWAKPGEPRSSALFWLGHGASNEKEAHLIVRGAAGDDEDARLGPVAFADHVADEHSRRAGSGHWAIVVVEACGGARFAQQVYADLLERRAAEGVMVVGSGRDLGEGHLGAFSAALGAVCAEYNDNDTEISLDDLGTRIKIRLRDRGSVNVGGTTDIARLRPPRRIEPVSAPVDVYTELRDVIDRLGPHEQAHFARKGMAADLGEFGWFFVGRDADRAAILRWLTDHEHGLLAVTGAAGVGKSALLGNVLLHARPEIVRALAATGLTDDGWAEADRLPAVDVSLHLTGATVQDVAAGLAQVIGVELGPGSVSPSECGAALLRAFRERTADPLVLLADSLDEAADPTPLAALFADLSGLPGVRIIVGTRPAGTARPGGERHLLDELGDGTLNHVDAHWVQREPEALHRYVQRRLLRDEALRRRLGADLDDGVRHAAERIASGDSADGIERGFLYARLAVREILAEPALLLPGRRARLDGLLALGHRAMFARAVERMSAEHPAAAAFLEALAYGLGRGIPRADQLWRACAQALAEPESELSNDDLDAVLELAGPYIMLDADDGQSVYRLAHRTFHEHYLARPEAPRRQRLVLAALVAAAQQPSINPYLQRYLSGHALATVPDGWAALGAHPAVLDRLDIRAVTADVLRHRGGLRTLPDQVQGTFMSAHLAALGTPADRPGLRQLGTARVHGRAATADPGRSSAAWEIRAADLRHHPLHLTLTGHRAAVTALAAWRTGADDIVLASAGRDGRVWTWDPTSGSAVRPVLKADPEAVVALVAWPDAERDVRLALAGVRTPVRAVEPLTGRTAAGWMEESGAPATALAVFTTVDGQAALAVGGFDGVVRVLKTADGRLLGRPMPGHRGAVNAITAFADAEAGVLLATAGTDRTVRIWNPATGRLVRLLPAAEAPLRVIALAGRHLVAGADDGTIIWWDTTDWSARPVAAHAGGVLALAALPHADGPLVASGGADRTVRLWRPGADAPAGAPLTGHAGAVTCLAVLPGRRGETRLAGGADDGTIRVWEPDPRADGPAPEPAVAEVAAQPADGGRDDRVWALIDAAGREVRVVATVDGAVSVTPPGVSSPVPLAVTPGAGPLRRAIALVGADRRSLVATAFDDGTIRVWNAATGLPRGKPLVGHDDWVNALAVVLRPAGPPLLVSGGDDGSVRLWDPEDGALLHTIPLGLRVVTLAAEGADLLVGTDEGTLRLGLHLDHLTGRTVGAPT
ncbi:AAA family ATPase [Dactylosporangium sp. CA-139114]|uniref:AAA family ATPase n=1 Tax=Dactylosporangium sp. CA-139114 TaxID=3239931 RepID=UPI003D976E73